MKPTLGHKAKLTALELGTSRAKSLSWMRRTHTEVLHSLPNMIPRDQSCEIHFNPAAWDPQSYPVPTTGVCGPELGLMPAAVVTSSPW